VRPVTLVLILHDHQPVGNFDQVFEHSYRDAYLPFLEFLERRPRFKIALHSSGPLLQWIALHAPDYLRRLRVLVERAQVELWGGGFFEPVLASIPESDRRGQIQAMSDWLELEVGQRPRGLWLTERVWEPSLASSLALAGVEYTAVDDAHFVAAGLPRDRLWGIYQTEDQGHALRVFPIHRELRYAIPFAAPEETIALLGRVAELHDDAVAVLGDDGEKFGVWPGTHALCYQERWLDRFADLIEANSWIELRSPSEAVAHAAPLGLIYLPTASYHEMQEWSLPPEGQERYHAAAERLSDRFGDETHDLLRGGLWRNFESRYPESSRPHKRVLHASRRLGIDASGDREAWKAARTHLWRAQCNDAYWHGVFGGLYLPHLRAAIYRELIAVETYLCGGRARSDHADLDLDGYDDAALENGNAAAWIGARGGSLWGFDDRRRLWNYGDTLARRPEYYHARLKQAVVGGAEGKTIHGALRLKEPGLARLVETYDARGRESFLDRWSESGVVHDWGHDRFAIEDRDGAGVVARAPSSGAPALQKQFGLAGDGSLEVLYTLSSDRPRAGVLAVELNLGLHVPNADDRYVEVEGRRASPSHFAARARHERVTRCAFVDEWADRRLDVACDPPATLERAPIETVSLSEAGAERVFQGVEASLHFDLALAPERSATIRIALVPRAAKEGAPR
jgi:alpha-amylase